MRSFLHLASAAYFYLLITREIEAAASVTEYHPRLEKRVAYGDETHPPFEFPFITALFVDTELNGELFNCGGTLLNERWILTAGQCSFTVSAGNGDSRDWNRTHVETGRFNLTKSVKQERKGRYDVEFQTTAPGFFDQLGPLFLDLGLWRIKGSAVGAAHVNLQIATYIRPGTIAKLAGWGRFRPADPDTSPVLRVADIEILSNRLCAKLLKPTEDFGPDFDGGAQICGKGVRRDRAITAGDAGSPLFIIDPKNRIPTIVGIASRTSIRNGTTLSIFTRVSKFVPFIKKTIS